MPSHTEVVGVCHSVMHILAPKSCVDTVVLSYLYLRALENTSRTDEKTLCCVLVGTGFVACLICFCIPQAIELLRDIVIYRVASSNCTMICFTTIFAIETCHTIRVLAGSSCTYYTTSNCHKKYATGFSIYTNSWITKTVITIPRIASVAFDNGLACHPCLTIRITDTLNKVYTTVADVTSTGTIVTNSQKLTILTSCNSRNTIRRVVMIPEILILALCIGYVGN